MKSSVKAGLASDIGRMRLGALAALGLGGALAASCKSSGNSGLVTAPMLETPVASSSAEEADAGVRVAHRPTVDPHPPRSKKCRRQVECLAPLAIAPSWPFSAPFERCDPTPIGEVGKFSPTETTAHRSSDPSTCCYLAFVDCSASAQNMLIRGRPLRDARGAAILADAVARGGWAGSERATAIDEERARFWLDAGAGEHASIAEFARLSLVLLGLGAPADLVADVHHAALDEIAHAEACFSIASRLAGRSLGPGPLEVSRAGEGASIEALVASTLRDGCMGESAAALDLAERARREPDETIAAALATMSRDEERHAALAWRILRFAATNDPHGASAAIDRFLEDPRPRSPLEARVLEAIVRPCLSSFERPRAPRGGDCARGA